MSFGGPNSTTLLVKPPLKGSFPLDHDGVCHSIVQEFLSCLKRVQKYNREFGDVLAATDQDVCRDLSKRYFECRLKNGLMEREEWEKLGFGTGDPANKRTG